MEVEGIGDFRVLRAKFQNDSCFSKMVPQPAKKPPVESLHLPSTDTQGVSSPRILNHGKIPISEHEERVCLAVHSSELMQSKPLLFPRVKLGNLYVAGKNEEPKKKVLERAVCEDATPRGDSQKPRPLSCIYQQAGVNTNSEEALIKNSFRHTLQIWESASTQDDRKCAGFITPQGMNGNHSTPLRALNSTITAENSKIRSAGKEHVLDFSTPKNSSPSRTPVLSQNASSLLPSRGYKRTEQNTKVTGFSQLAYDPHKPSEISQYLKAPESFLHPSGPEKQLEVKNRKLPKIKPLPSVQSLGSPPKKPLRPPKVNLSAFRQSALHVGRRNETAAVDDDYMTPEKCWRFTVILICQRKMILIFCSVYAADLSAKSEELHNYEETISYVKQSGNSVTTCALQDIVNLSSTRIQEDDKKQKSFLFDSSSTERVTKDEKEDKWKLDFDRERQQQVNMSTISGREDMLHKPQINEDHEGGKSRLQVKKGEASDVLQTEKWLAKDMVEHSDCFQGIHPHADEDVVASSRKILKPMQPAEDVYDDVEGIESAMSQASDAFSSFTSDSFSEDNCDKIYEDIHNEDHNPLKLDLDGIEKLKKFGKFFKKDKLKLKNAKMKENHRMLSSSVPNLDVSHENTAYDDTKVDGRDAKEKDDKHKNWKQKFLMLKDKDTTRSSEDTQKNVFKVKKNNIDQRKKVTKEEKLFREKFMYNKEIKVISIAVAQCSNVTSKRKLDLPIRTGEQLDVIDITEENQVICRNSEGKYGYVLLEHLNFRH
nr:FYN-binding protein 2 isoform X2 [Pelodiscus sinensis]|eukprot:XP_025045635.1 FYN-binding protein 2 isoform X2 [Pelodiscus sinensis]